jgi:hypothetical protein
MQNSGIIKNMITDNGNGTYGVAFHVKGATEYVTVNNVLQTGCNSGPNMWATLLEKAYAQLQAINVTTGNSYTGNSFTAIGNGGLPEYALESITGASQITDYSGSGTSWLCRTYNSSLSGTGSQSGLSNATVLSSLKTHLAAGMTWCCRPIPGATTPQARCNWWPAMPCRFTALMQPTATADS